jgi:hypothetical protein
MAVILVGILTSKSLICIKVRAVRQADKHEQGGVTQLVKNDLLKLKFLSANMLKFPKYNSNNYST